MKLPKIVFLDRDGTINEEVNYLHKPEDFRFVPGVPAALRRLHEAGYLLVVITNQAGIARGYYSEADCEALNRYMAEMLAAQGAGLTAAYYCPHHPVHGIGRYRRACSCRKPKDGLFLQCLADMLFAGEPIEFAPNDIAPGAAEASLTWRPERRVLQDQVDFHESPLMLSDVEMAALRQWKAENAKDALWYMIGDKRIDTQAGHQFGIRSILVGSGYGREEKEKAVPEDYDVYFDTLGEAAEWILKQEQ